MEFGKAQHHQGIPRAGILNDYYRVYGTRKLRVNYARSKVKNELEARKLRVYVNRALGRVLTINYIRLGL